ncbi:MAG: hypothetical protein OEY49_12245 [Candidatus Heimdallarchaeota archaeon]|nr:hypothetical protein [Candidatus Heimdallarchaeota archaeon]
MKLKSILLNLSIARTYFIRGHSHWFSYLISLLNFITITFYLLIDELTIIPDEAKKFRYYLIFFILTYFPLATFIGYYDLKKGTFRVEQNITKEFSPLWKELFTILEDIKKEQIEIKLDIEKLNQS